MPKSDTLSHIVPFGHVQFKEVCSVVETHNGLLLLLLDSFGVLIPVELI